MRISYARLDLPTGPAFAAATEMGLTRLELKAPPLGEFAGGLEAEFGVRPMEDERPFTALALELKHYFAGEPVVFTSRLDTRGTPFQKKVWRALMDIPYGNVRSYKWLAGVSGNPGAARAVGGALHGNRIPIVIPCHRVIESSGGLGGFGAGLEIKRTLLRVEGVLPPYGV